MTIIEITSELQFDELLNCASTNKYLFVDFYAQWCGPCKRIAPHIHKLSETYSNVTFLKVDIDECQELAERYNIKSMPTFLIFTVGKPNPSEPIIGADTRKVENALKVLTSNIIPNDDF